VQGGAAKDEATAGVRRLLKRNPKRALAGAGGLLAMRLELTAAGSVKRAAELANTLVPTGADDAAPARATKALRAATSRLRVAAGRTASVVVAPVHVLDGAATL
jgi:hypothetical protein